jgi:hypothetical protein
MIPLFQVAHILSSEIPSKLSKISLNFPFFQNGTKIVDQASVQEVDILARHWWLTPIIIATQEAEIRRITVQSQPQANSFQDPILKKKLRTHKKKGLPECLKW